MSLTTLVRPQAFHQIWCGHSAVILSITAPVDQAYFKVLEQDCISGHAEQPARPAPGATRAGRMPPLDPLAAGAAGLVRADDVVAAIDTDRVHVL